MSCPHGNHVDGCELCEAIDRNWIQGYDSGRKEAKARITDLTATSIAVRDKETITFTVDSRTHFTKWITQKPWQEDTRLDARALRVGRLVAVHPRKDDGSVADWVQVATDVR